jgi:DNA mismatch endonuclease (patch repair protein)
MADVMTRKQRSYCMSRIRGKDTGIERLVRSEIQKRGFRFRKHVTGLPGRPDLVFVRRKVAVFIDGDFWHGRAFKQWGYKLTPKWRDKIECNIRRDRRNFGRLRRMGWHVVRVWEKDINRDLERVVERIVKKLEEAD